MYLWTILYIRDVFLFFLPMQQSLGHCDTCSPNSPKAANHFQQPTLKYSSQGGPKDPFTLCDLSSMPIYWYRGRYIYYIFFCVYMCMQICLPMWVHMWKLEAVFRMYSSTPLHCISVSQCSY